jgi:hypothetical protein
LLETFTIFSVAQFVRGEKYSGQPHDFLACAQFLGGVQNFLFIRTIFLNRRSIFAYAHKILLTTAEFVV